LRLKCCLSLSAECHISRGGLEGTKIKVERGNIQVDEYCRTGEANVYAIGDVIPTPWLAHLASKEGILVVEQIAGKIRAIEHATGADCTYCDLK